jgi:hypothetical protein
MPYYNSFETIPQTGEFFLLWDDEDRAFYPAFWDTTLDPKYPIRFIDIITTCVNSDDEDAMRINGYTKTPVNDKKLSWLPWPTPDTYTGKG